MDEHIFACGRGHTIIAWAQDGERADLTGFFCPLCMGAVKNHGDLVMLELLAPMQVMETV